MVPIMATLLVQESTPEALCQALGEEVGLEYQLPGDDGSRAWCVGSLDLNIGTALHIISIQTVLFFAHHMQNHVAKVSSLPPFLPPSLPLRMRISVCMSLQLNVCHAKAVTAGCA